MEIYFFDRNKRYVGHRALRDDEVTIPPNATETSLNIGDGQEAYLIDGNWIVSDVPVEVQADEINT